MLDSRQRLTICHKCREQPAGCWRVTAPKDARLKLIAAATAARDGECPIGKWGEEQGAGSQVSPLLAPRCPLVPPANPGPVDVVYFLGAGSTLDDWELRYSLRSIHKNFLDLDRVFVVGHRPHWLTGVEHLDVPDRHKRNKDANLVEKLLAVCRWGVSDWFLNVSDDQLLVKPVRFADCRAYHLGDLARRRESFWAAGHRWKDRLRHTLQYLAGRGYETLHCDTHTPYPVHRETFWRIVPADYAAGLGYTIHTLWANSAPLARVPLIRHKATFEQANHNAAHIRKRLDCPDAKFCGYNEAGLTEELRAEIERRFPDPSPWEANTILSVAACGFTVRDATRREGLRAIMHPYHPLPDAADSPPPAPCSLLFHFAPWFRRAEQIAFHVRCLARHLEQFQKIRINLVTGPEFMDPFELEGQLRRHVRGGADVKFIHRAHGPLELGEVRPFFDSLLPEVGEDENICYGHSKGCILSAMPGGRAWAELMYEATMARASLACELLKTHPCAGSFIRRGDSRKGAQWHYSGNFFWFRAMRRFAGWNEYHPSRYGLECWPGRLVARQDAGEMIGARCLLDMVHGRRGLIERYLAQPWGCGGQGAGSGEQGARAPSSTLQVPRLSIIIPTIGRETLARTLASIAQQKLIAGDEVLVVGDGPQPAAAAIFAASCLPGRYLDGPEIHDWGGSQRTAGMRRARGDLLLFMDDDDVYLPGAFERVRAEADRAALNIFRMERPKDSLPIGRRMVRGNVSTQMLCVPNRAEWLGQWSARYEGDFDFARSTLDRIARLKFHEAAIARWRP